MRMHLLLLLGGGAAAAVDAAAAAKACAVSPPKTLSWSCGGLCAANASCIAYPPDEVSPCDSPKESPWRTCVSSPSGSCDVQCIKAVEPTSSFRFFVAFNASQPTQPPTPPPTLPPGNVASFPAREEEIPFESNEFLRRIGVLDLPKTTTSLSIVGSRSGDLAARGYVVDLEIDAKAFKKSPQLTDIRLTNINLGDRALDISTVVPRTVQWLHLRNAMLTKFPSGILALSKLQSLALNRNYLTDLPSTLPLAQLSALQLDENDLTAFNISAMPALEYLYLSGNKLTAFPYDSVLRLPALRLLHISSNPFQKKVLFSTDQFAKMTNWTTFQIDSAVVDNASCSASQLRTLPGSRTQTICVVSAKEWSSLQAASTLTIKQVLPTASVDPGTPTSESEPSSSPTLDNTPANTGGSTDSMVAQGVVGALIGFVLIVAVAAAFVLWKRRRNSAEKGDSSTHAGSSIGVDQDVGDLEDDAGDPNRSPSVKSEHQAASSTLSPVEKLDLQSIRLAAKDLHDLRVIGSGSSGSIIWLVRFRKSRELASKRLLAPQNENSEVYKARRSAFLREIQIASTLTYPSIVTFVGVAWTSNGSDLQALFEYMPGGDLESHLSKSSPETLLWKGQNQKLRLAIDVIEALVYTHSFSPVVLHRNLRARSVLLTEDGKAKLSNFSDARRASEDATMTTTGVGSGRWLAPEFLLGSSSYDAPSDIYAYGVLLSELDTHQLPYAEVVDANGSPLPESALLQQVAKDGLRPSFSSDCPYEISELAAQCLAQDPSSRPTAMHVAFTLRKLVQTYEL